MTKIIDRNDLYDRGIRYSKAHLWRLVKAGAFPAPVKLSAGRLAWIEQEVEDWLTGKVAARDSRVSA